MKTLLLPLFMLSLPVAAQTVVEAEDAPETAIEMKLEARNSEGWQAERKSLMDSLLKRGICDSDHFGAEFCAKRAEQTDTLAVPEASPSGLSDAALHGQLVTPEP